MPSEQPLQPAVPIDQSVTEDAIICLVDGRPLKKLKGYLFRRYGLTWADYLQRYNLPVDYPSIAPASSKRYADALAKRRDSLPKSPNSRRHDLIRTMGDIVEIVFRDGRVARLWLETARRINVWDYEWFARENDNYVYRIVPIRRRRYRYIAMARLILDLADGDTTRVVHKDGNGLNLFDQNLARRTNLAEHPPAIIGDQVYLPLSNSPQTAVVDLDDYLRLDLGRYKWRLAKGDGRSYVARFERQVGTRKRAAILLHRVIVDAEEGIEVDHRDLDTLNNRRVNLRMATRSGNMCNRFSWGASPYKGVYFNRNAGKWEAVVWCRLKRHYVGRFEDEVAAATARDEVARTLHGQYGRYNFPRDNELPARRGAQP